MHMYMQSACICIYVDACAGAYIDVGADAGGGPYVCVGVYVDADLYVDADACVGTDVGVCVHVYVHVYV